MHVLVWYRSIRLEAVKQRHLGDFGPLAVEASPQIEPWLESPNAYVRLLAATTIVKLDPNRTEFVSTIRNATMSDHPVVPSLAMEFFGDGQVTND